MISKNNIKTESHLVLNWQGTHTILRVISYQCSYDTNQRPRSINCLFLFNEKKSKHWKNMRVNVITILDLLRSFMASLRKDAASRDFYGTQPQFMRLWTCYYKINWSIYVFLGSKISHYEWLNSVVLLKHLLFYLHVRLFTPSFTIFRNLSAVVTKWEMLHLSIIRVSSLIHYISNENSITVWQRTSSTYLTWYSYVKCSHAPSSINEVETNSYLRDNIS